MRALATLLAVLACLVLPVAAVSTWVQLQVVDTSRYVGAVAPLSSSPQVRDAATTAVESAVSQATGGASSSSSQVSAAIAAAVQRVVASDAFALAWTDGNRVAHRQVIAVLADDRDAVRPDGTITVDLGSLARPLADEVGGGSQVSSALAGIDVPLDLVDARDLGRAQRAYRVVHAVGLWPLVVWGVLVVAALLLPGARRRVLGVLGFGSLLAGALVAGLLLVGRSLLVGSLPSSESGVVGVVWDALVHSLWLGLGGVAIASVLALLLAAVIRPSRRVA